MAEIVCEACRDLQEDYAESKMIRDVLCDTQRSFSWTVKIQNWEYKFDDSRGNCSVRDIAMLIKLFLASESYESHKVGVD